MNCGIAIFPSKEIQDYANSYRKRYDPHYSLISPHLTIREKEDWTELQINEATRHLEQVASRFPPFTLRFNRFSTFFPTNNTIYLALEDKKTVTELHEAICAGEWSEKQASFVYNPHLTIGQQMSNDELHDVLPALKQSPVDLQCVIDRVHLLYQTENGAWTTYQTFILKG